MSGIQEILLVGLIVVGLIYLPRLRTKHDPRVVMSAKGPLPGWMRLAILISLLWLLGAAVWWQPWQGSLERFVVIGVAPLVAAWGGIWVMAGYKRRK